MLSVTPGKTSSADAFGCPGIATGWKKSAFGPDRALRHERDDVGVAHPQIAVGRDGERAHVAPARLRAAVEEAVDVLLVVAAALRRRCRSCATAPMLWKALVPCQPPMYAVPL